MDPMTVASRLVDHRFPDAACAWLTGSTARGQATDTSDVDVLVVLTEVAPFRETLRSDGSLVELFVHSERSLTEWYAREAADFRCGLAHMVAQGVPVTSFQGNELAAALQETAASLISAGPPTRTAEQIDALRYHLSASIDDLVGSGDGDERCFIGLEIVRLASELELAAKHSWTGRGRWLHHWLDVVNPEAAHTLSAGLGELPHDTRALCEAAADVLTRAGGRLQEGYRLG
jgi:hypothetical protein